MRKNRLLLFTIPVLFLQGCISNVPEESKMDTLQAHAQGTSLAPHYADSFFEISDNKIYSAELRFQGGNISVGTNSADLIIHTDSPENPDVEKAGIKITPWMPEHGHGVQAVPVVSERGAGLYSVENIQLIMEGHWQLKMDIDGRTGKDTVVFDFPDVSKTRYFGSSPHHETTAAMMDMSSSMMAPAGTDLSTTRQSVRKMFTVSYSLQKGPISLNHIHSWILEVKNSDGNPASGLDIQVDGDMPAHGHGLPTRPKVSRETSPGTYLVEGMKFSMPGWWKVIFYLKKGGETDSVIFNLQLR